MSPASSEACRRSQRCRIKVQQADVKACRHLEAHPRCTHPGSSRSHPACEPSASVVLFWAATALRHVPAGVSSLHGAHGGIILILGPCIHQGAAAAQHVCSAFEFPSPGSSAGILENILHIDVSMPPSGQQWLGAGTPTFADKGAMNGRWLGLSEHAAESRRRSTVETGV